MNLTARLDALEARKVIEETLDSNLPKTPQERAERLYWHIQKKGFTGGYHRIIPQHIAGWPFYRESDGLPTGYEPRIAFLRFDALQPIFDECGDRVFKLLLGIAKRLRPPEGGGVDFYFKDGDDVPLVRIWFEPPEGADLL
jgi:hypothetical protein